MANPQLEDGYTKIADEILEALIAFRIPGVERQCLDLIIRKTFGYGKTWDRISNSQFVKYTGLKKANVSKSIKSLMTKNIVIKKDNSFIPSYRLNKDYSKWKQLSKRITKKAVIKEETPVIKKHGHKELSKNMDTRKKTLTKEKGELLPMEKAKLIYDYKKIINGSKKHTLVMQYTQGNESYEQLQQRLKPELAKLEKN